jgi:bacteriocin biosynthesis cyclodehydratase domain-containing protein
VRPQLLRDAYCVPLDNDGVYVRSTHRVMTIEDVPIYPWVERLIPYLTGAYTLEELTSRLPEDQRQLVADLVRTLHQQGLVRDLVTDLPHSLSEAELAAYEAELTYLETYVDSPEHRFERYRHSRTLLVGSGALIEAASLAALRSGLLSPHLLLTADSTTDIDRLRWYAAEAAERDSEQSLHWSAAPDLTDEAAWASLLGDADLAVHLAGAPAPPRAAVLDRLSAESDALLLTVIAGRDTAWIGPLSVPDDPETCWRAAWYRLHPASGGHDDDRLLDRTGNQSEHLIGAVPAVLANHALFRCFTHLTQSSDRDLTRDLLRLNLETLETSEHRLLPHPFAVPAGPDTAVSLRSTVADLAARPAQSDDQLSQSLVQAGDPHLGIFTDLDEHDATQLPLRVSCTVVRDPLGSEVDVPVWGGGLDFGTARLRTGREAAAIYATLLRDDRRLDRGGIWGLRLPDEAPVLVPATRVFVDATELRRLGRPVGATCGSSWEDALTRGLLEQCVALTVEELASRRYPCPPLPRSLVEGDPHLAHLNTLLSQCAPHPVCYDLTGRIGVPCVAAASASSPAACAAGLTLRQALAGALEAALLLAQSRLWNEPLYQARSVDLPDHLRGRRPRQADPRLRLPPDPTVVASRLAAVGRRPVAVPLHHDPAIAALLPFLLRVVVMDDG